MAYLLNKTFAETPTTTTWPKDWCDKTVEALKKLGVRSARTVYKWRVKGEKEYCVRISKKDFEKGFSGEYAYGYFWI